MKTYTSFRQLSLSRVFRFAAILFLALAFAGSAFCGPIHDAAGKGDVKKIKALLQADPTLVNNKDKLGNTPLHYAAFHSQTAAAQALLDAGADVNAKNSYGPFVPEDLGKILWSSNKTQDPVVLLQVHGVDTKDMSNGYTPLDLALFAASRKQIVALLLAKGADVNARASSGATPLWWAVLRNQKEDVLTLLEKGANVNLANAYGDTILDCALIMQWESLVQILIDHGADVNAVNQGGTRPLSFALGMENHKWAELLKKHGAHE